MQNAGEGSNQNFRTHPYKPNKNPSYKKNSNQKSSHSFQPYKNNGKNEDQNTSSWYEKLPRGAQWARGEDSNKTSTTVPLFKMTAEERQRAKEDTNKYHIIKNVYLHSFAIPGALSGKQNDNSKFNEQWQLLKNKLVAEEQNVKQAEKRNRRREKYIREAKELREWYKQRKLFRKNPKNYHSGKYVTKGDMKQPKGSIDWNQIYCKNKYNAHFNRNKLNKIDGAKQVKHKLVNEKVGCVKKKEETHASSSKQPLKKAKTMKGHDIGKLFRHPLKKEDTMLLLKVAKQFIEKGWSKKKAKAGVKMVWDCVEKALSAEKEGKEIETSDLALEEINTAG